MSATHSPQPELTPRLSGPGGGWWTSDPSCALHQLLVPWGDGPALAGMRRYRAAGWLWQMFIVLRSLQIGVLKKVTKYSSEVTLGVHQVCHVFRWAGQYVPVLSKTQRGPSTHLHTSFNFLKTKIARKNRHEATPRGAGCPIRRPPPVSPRRALSCFILCFQLNVCAVLCFAVFNLPTTPLTPCTAGFQAPPSLWG